MAVDAITRKALDEFRGQRDPLLGRLDVVARPGRRLEPALVPATEDVDELDDRVRRVETAVWGLVEHGEGVGRRCGGRKRLEGELVLARVQANEELEPVLIIHIYT